MAADTKTKSWAPSITKPVLIFIMLNTNVTMTPSMLCMLLSVHYLYTHRSVCVWVCMCVLLLLFKAFLLHLETSVQPGRRCGSQEAQANGQLMGWQTAQLVPKCLQIKQFIILRVYTHTHKYIHKHVHKYTHQPPLSRTNIQYKAASSLSQHVHRLVSFSKHSTDHRLSLQVMECICNCVLYMEIMTW